jgi:hypothetical protein
MLFFFTKENIETIKKLEDKTPNDMEFGEKLRALFGSERYILDIPNDQELGRTVRKLIKSL